MSRDRTTSQLKRNITSKTSLHANSPMISVTEEVLQDFKDSKPVWEDLLKLASKYHTALEAVIEASKSFTHGLKAVELSTKHSSPDLGRALLQVAQAQEEVEENQSYMCQVLMSEFIQPSIKALKNDRENIVKWEKGYKEHFSKMESDLKKIEKQSKEVGKKKPSQLQQIILTLTEKVKDLEKSRQDKLRELLIMDRGRHCFLVLHYTNFLKAQTKMHDDASVTLNSEIPLWTEQAFQPELLPPESERLITNKQRTYTSIVGENSTQNYNTSDEFAESEYEQDYSSAYNYDQDGGGGGGGQLYPGGQARALYDNIAEDPSELPFSAGEVIYVIEAINEEWWTCENQNGQQGLVCTSYMEGI